MPRLSVIVPVYKVEKYLHACVDSILNQTYKDFELILVDDGSPDNSGKICDEYAAKDNRIKVIHKENGGQSSARNAGLDIAQGELISFVDSDDMIVPEMFEQMVSFLVEHQLEIVCCDTIIVRGSRQRKRYIYEENKVFNGEEAVLENLNGRIDNAVWNKIYKKDLFDDLRFVEGVVYEDVRLIYKLFYKSSKSAYLRKAYYYYYKRPNSTIATSFNSKSRYDCYVSFKERLNFAIEKKYYVIDECRKQALETSLATMTAFYANGEDKNSERFLDVSDFIKANKNDIKYQLRCKQRVLLWSFDKCNLIYKSYAVLSGMAKKLRVIIGEAF